MALEDFDGYTEEDSGSSLDVTSDTITASTLTMNEEARVYTSKGVGHFGTTFEHLFKTNASLIDNNAKAGTWAVSNVVEDVNYWEDNSSQAMAVTWIDDAYVIYLNEYEAADSDGSNRDQSTDYFIIVERTGDTTCEARIYSDSDRTSLVDTVRVAVPSGRAYQYIFGVNSYVTGSGLDSSFTVEDLDLQEAAGGRIGNMIGQGGLIGSGGPIIGTGGLVG